MNVSFVISYASFHHDDTPISFLYYVTIICCVFGSPVASTILFPFYFRVSRKNRMRDRETAIFPFINYFYWVTCLTEAVLYLATVLILVNLVCFPPFRDKYWLPIWLVYVLSKLTIAMMLNILTSLLALHRSLLYFFPVIREAITPTGNTTKRLIWALHCFVFFFILHSIYSMTISIETKEYWAQKVFLIQFSLYGFVLLSIFPYFLMIVSIRKLTNLTSRTHSKPEQYIKFQIFVIIVAKLLMVSFVFISIFPKDQDSQIDLDSLMFLKHLIGETALSSLTIQVSYILNNKVNLDTLKTTCCLCKKSRVEPYSSTGNNNQ